MKIMDLQLHIDGVLLKDDESIEQLIEKLQKEINSNYPIRYDILYEEPFE